MPRNKRKRFSRRLRRLKGIGKKPTQSTTISEKAPKIVKNSQENISAATVKSVRTRKNFNLLNNINFSIPDSEIVPFDKAKSREIYSHLRTVITVSISCLVILGALYYFERQHDWVNGINLHIKGAMDNWNWKF